jgi:hypothetical protein
MKLLSFLRISIIVSSFLCYLNATAKEPIKIIPSFNYYYDLSDSYGKGSLFSGSLGLSQSFYGLNMDFGYFQGHSVFIYNIVIEDLEKTIEIKFDEVSNMKTSSVSLVFIPIKKDWITADLNCGIALNKAILSQFNKVDYSYSLIENKFIYLYKDYKLVRRTHIGYQVGFDISLYFLPKIGFQISSRIQDLNNGGTFFFVGGGLCFRL